jgi:hypothetical protein
LVKEKTVSENEHRLAVVEWEDIASFYCQPIPDMEDMESRILTKQTVGFLYEGEDRVMVVSDYDLTHRGAKWCNNDFTIIPRGVIKKITYLKETK